MNKTVMTMETLQTRGKTVVAMGNFDGVHRGHQKIVQTLTRLSHEHGLPSLVLTYDPHPQYFLSPHNFSALTTLEEKLDLLKSYGASEVCVMRFDEELRSLPATTFIEKILLERLNAAVVVIGANHRFGRGGEGNIELLKEILVPRGVKVVVVDLGSGDAAGISSSRIRMLLNEENLESACELLGHPFEYRGEVVEGDKRGRELGFPTANLKTPDEPKLLLPPGVYGGRVHNLNGVFSALINAGYRPSFGGETYKIEAHLLHFTGHLYGQTVRIELHFRLRPEIRFGSKAELIRQMHIDRQNFEGKASVLWPSERN